MNEEKYTIEEIEEAFQKIKEEMKERDYENIDVEKYLK